MNIIFTAIFLLSAIVMLITAPTDFLPAMLDGGLNAAKCCLTLFCIYAVWMGLSAVAEDARITEKTAKLLSKPCGKLFKTQNPAALENITMNISCNLLGIGGAATPYAVKAVDALEKDGNTFAQNLLFIINATSIQLIPHNGYSHSRRRGQRCRARYRTAVAHRHRRFNLHGRGGVYTYFKIQA